jgi:hypothetical protein
MFNKNGMPRIYAQKHTTVVNFLIRMLVNTVIDNNEVYILARLWIVGEYQKRTAYC